MPLLLLILLQVSNLSSNVFSTNRTPEVKLADPRTFAAAHKCLFLKATLAALLRRFGLRLVSPVKSFACFAIFSGELHVSFTSSHGALALMGEQLPKRPRRDAMVLRTA